MLRALNRIAWVVSLTLGWLVMFYIVSIFDHNNVGEWFLGILLLGTLLGLIAKGIFLSHDFIERCLRESRQHDTSSFMGKIDVYDTPKEETEASQPEETQDDTIPVDWNMNPLEASHVPQNYQTTATQEDYIPELEPVEEIREPEPKKPREPNFIEKFFAENVIAKIGGILLFLGVLFFLSLMYTTFGPVGKTIIGFLVGFAIYGTGIVLDKKNLINESRVLLGIGILVNYLVILTGRYLLGGSDVFLSEGVTFMFLIMNTILGIVTSLIYKSKTLLVFSFIAAYLNPFLIGAKAGTTPYTLVGYSTILSFGAFFLSYLNQEKDESISRFLLSAGFVGGNILCLVAPSSNTIGWIVQLVVFAIISLSTIILAYRQKFLDSLPFFLIGSYVGVIIFLILGLSRFTTDQIGFAVFIFPMLAIIGLFLTNSFLFALKTTTGLLILLFAPLPIVIGLIISGVFASYFAIMLGMIVILYLAVFAKLIDKLSTWMQYVYFAVLGIFFFITSTTINVAHMGSLIPPEQAYTVFIIAAVFLITSYYLSTKEKLAYLYTIGTLGTVFILLPLIKTEGPLLPVSIAATSIFAVANMLQPFWSRHLRSNSAQNIIIGFIIGLLFVGGQLYRFGDIYFPGVTLGLAYLGLAIIYTVFGMIMIQLLSVSSLKTADNEAPSSDKNIVFAYLGVALSLFTLSVALVLSSHPEIIGVVWLFEATILFWFSRATKENKVYIAAIIVMIIGLGKMTTLFSLVQQGEYKFLLPLTLILGSFFGNLYILSKDENDTGKRLIHDILHIIGMILIGSLIKSIIVSTGLGYNILGISIFILILSVAYTHWGKRVLSMTLLVGMILAFIAHIGQSSSILANIAADGRTALKFIQYGVIFIFWGAEYIFNTKSKSRIIAQVMQISFWTYAFIVSTIFVHDIFTSPFSITIYWGVIAFALLIRGIDKDIIGYRTTGLYILSLTLGKILVYDIWYSIDNGIMRVAALMLVGILMIVISTRYSKRYKGNMMAEFNIANTIGGNMENKGADLPKTENSDKNPAMNQKIADIDISGLTSAIFTSASGKKVEIRTKNMIRITKYTIGIMGKSTFKANELRSLFLFIQENFKSEISPTDYKKIASLMDEFVSEGGEITLQ